MNIREQIKLYALDFTTVLITLFVQIHVIIIGLAVIFSILLNFFNPPVTSLIVYRAMEGTKFKERHYIDMAKIPRDTVNMLIFVEDHKFFEHGGFDLESIFTAMEINNEWKGKVLWGGSTLTQQLSRTILLVPDKSYIRKYVELLFSITIDLLVNKKRILELYFNYAEWGPGIFGIDSAAMAYYGRHVNNISHEDAAALVCLLSSPIKYNPSNFMNRLILKDRYERILENTAWYLPKKF